MVLILSFGHLNSADFETERTTTNTLHTVQLLALYRAGGLDAVFDVCRTLMSSIDTITKVREESRSESQSQELVHAYGGLKVALHLLHPMVSSKPLFESGQTILIMTRDKKDTDPDYFEAHNFLVRLRLSALPLLQDLWEAHWLLQTPLSVSRSVVQTVLELVNGENEETKAESEVGPTPIGISRPPGSDENRIRQLTDMGFPRSAAERALIRTHNNVSAATELLLAHPFPFAPDPETEPAAEPPAQEAADPAAVEDAPIVTEDESAAPSTEAVEAEPAAVEPPVVETPVPTPVGKSSEEWLKELNEGREPLRGSISRRALLLVDEHLSLIFDLHVAFIRPSNAHQQKAVQDLVEDIKEFSPFAYDVQEQPLANRCRLLALVLCEAPSSLTPELRGTLTDSLLALLLSNPVSIDPERPTIPRWLAAHLLVTEALFTLADEPRAIALPKADEPIVPQPLTVGPALAEARTIVFDFCLRLLAIPDLPNDELLSTLRLFVLLTRDSESASQFVKRDGISLLFSRLRTSPVNGSSSYIATILRHVVEDSNTINHIMTQAIKRYFAQPRSRIVDITTYARSCSAMALRDPKVFIQVTQSLCDLGAPFSASPPHLSLKQEHANALGDKASKKTEAAGTTDMQVDTPPVPAVASTEPPDTTIHFLVAELMRTAKVINDPSTLEASPANVDSNSPAGMSPDAKVKDQCQYACFLMQCLTELLFSYDSCKGALLTFSPKKKSQTPAKENASKYRTNTLNFLLTDLISYGTVNPQSTTDTRESIAICNWAMSVLVALCVDSSSTLEAKEVSAELVAVRKFVLEAISRAIKDLPASDSVEARYGRLFALADLCHRLLTVRFNTVSRKQQDEAPTQIAKIMLEKNFVTTLTHALSEVDLNYPNVRGLVSSILRPLEYL